MTTTLSYDPGRAYRTVLRGAPIDLDPLVEVRAEVEAAAWQRQGRRDALAAAAARGDDTLLRVLTPRALAAKRRYARAVGALREQTG